MDDQALTTTHNTSSTPAATRPLDPNPAAAYLAGLAVGSRRTMGDALHLMAGLVSNGQHDAFTLPWGELRSQHTAAIRAKLAEGYRFSTVNKMLSALRGTLKAAWRLGQMTAEDYQRAADVKSITGERLPAGRAITAEELGELMDTCANDPSVAGARDAAIVAILYACGLRRAELVSLDVADFDQVAGTLAVRGKRNKVRSVPIANGALDALADWLTVRGGEPGPLFHSTKGTNKGGRLTTQAIFDMLTARATAAGVSHLSPHDFRRTFVSDLIDAGADVGTVQKLTGHANIQTTLRYDQRPEAAKRKAVDLLHVPYRRRQMPAGEER
jgi:site-specific recombinase XerD